MLAIGFMLVWSGGSRADSREETARSIPNFDALHDIGEELVDIDSPLRGLFELPDSLENPLHAQRATLEEKLGLRFALVYTALYQNATAGKNKESAGIGRLEVFGTFDVLGKWFGDPGRNTGVLGFALETTHRYADIPPAELGSNIGSLWGTTDGYEKRNPNVRQLWWQQGLLDDALTLTLGKLDPNNFYDGHRLGNADRYFSNLAFSFSPASAQPEEGLGVHLLIAPTDQWYLSAGLHDANGRRTKAGFERFGKGEFFYGAELGFTPEIAGLGLGNYRIHGWYKDEASVLGIEKSYGFSLGFDQEVWVGEDVLLIPFLRWGYQGRNAVNTRQFVSFGTGVAGFLESRDDIAGLAFGWGEPSQRPRRDQYVTELFYRIQISRSLRLTPSYQLIFQPSLSPGRDVLGVLGLRARLSF